MNLDLSRTSSYLGALMMSVQQISGQACDTSCVIVFFGSSFVQVFRFHQNHPPLLFTEVTQRRPVEKSGIPGTFIVSGRNVPTLGDGTTGTSWCVASARLCGTGVGGSLPLWSGKLPTIMGCNRRRCHRYHHDQHQYCCLWHQFLVLFSEAFHS